MGGTSLALPTDASTADVPLNVPPKASFIDTARSSQANLCIFDQRTAVSLIKSL